MRRILSLPQRFNHVRDCSTVGLWNANIREAVNGKSFRKALMLFRQMKQKGLEPNNLTFPFIAKACAKLSDLKCSQIIHTHVVKSPYWSDIYVQTAMVDMYIKCRKLDFAYSVFEKMPQRDVTSWNAMLAGYAQMGLCDRGSTLLNEMRLGGFQPDSLTLVALTQLVIHKKSLNSVKAIHCIGIHSGMEADVSVANTWISAYAKCGDLELAEMVFDRINKSTKTLISWNSMIAGCASFKKPFKAITFFKLMLRAGFRDDISTAVSLLSSCVDPGVIFEGRMIQCHGMKMGCDMDITVANTLISMYCKCGDIYSARYLFDTMLCRTCVSWTAMISGYAEKGDLDEAMTLFHTMESSGEKPDLVTVLSLISGCAQTGALELGFWIENYIALNGLKDNTRICNALIDMYAKCGSINVAREIFFAMPEKTVVSWTAMISGFALNGKFKEALDLFFQMVGQGLKPNHITFIAVLRACSHTGLFDKGLECFDLMTKIYKVIPGLEHYSCMVDLLGRKGNLKEALKFIQNMPIKPDAGIWGALLGACKIHCDFETGEYVACQLFEMEPETAVSYVGMANIYASVGRWDRVAAIRTKMRSKWAKKSPGYSIVQLNGKNYAFTVEDRCHPEGLLIYGLLHSLSLQLTVHASSLLEGIFEYDFR